VRGVRHEKRKAIRPSLARSEYRAFGGVEWLSAGTSVRARASRAAGANFDTSSRREPLLAPQPPLTGFRSGEVVLGLRVPVRWLSGRMVISFLATDKATSSQSVRIEKCCLARLELVSVLERAATARDGKRQPLPCGRGSFETVLF